MKTESHKLLGEYLINHCRSVNDWRYKKAFLWGCVEPDYNVLTYLKGSRSIQPFRGHNFKNAEHFILGMIGQLERTKRWGIKEYYRLGKLIHYISDAFTYPHNEHCSESLKGHLRYEGELHNSFRDFVAAPQKKPEESASSVEEYVLSAHRRYVNASAGVSTDMPYIVDTTRTAFCLLIPESEAISGLSWGGEYENTHYHGLIHAGR